MSYQLLTQQSKAIKKCVSKWNHIDVSNNNIVGTVTIKSYRKYMLHEEVDIIFQGKVKAINWGRVEWKESDIMQKSNTSKVKVYRLIRKAVLSEVSEHMKIFGVKLKYYQDIKKVNWK